MRSTYAVVSLEEVAERVAAELLAGGPSQLERDRRLGHDRKCLHRGDVAALHERLAGLASLQIDRPQRAHQRRQRLHRRTHDHVLAVRDAAFDPAGEVRLTVERALLVGEDLVVRLRAAPLGELEPGADLDALHRLNPHQRGRQPGVQALVLGRVRAEPRRDSARDDFDDAADGVALGSSLVDPLLRAPRSRRGPRPRSRSGRAAPSPPSPRRPRPRFASRSPARGRPARRRGRT